MGGKIFGGTEVDVGFIPWQVKIIIHQYFESPSGDIVNICF